MRISKTASEEIAKLTLRPKRIEIESITTRTSRKLAELCIESLPSGLSIACESFCDYIKTTSTVQVRAENLKISGAWPLRTYTDKRDLEYIYIPSKSLYNFPLIKVSKKDADEINRWVDKLELLEKEYKSILSELAKAIFNLRTYNRISENIPEVIPHLPKVTANSMLQVDITKLRSRITN